MNNLLLTIAAILLLFTGCVKIQKPQIESIQPETDYSRLNSFFNEEMDFSQLDNYATLIVINEMGDCINCNNSFAQAMAGNEKNDNILFLISAQGSRVDISKYLDNQEHKVLFDHRNLFNRLNLIQKSAIIKLQDEQIDTIIQIDQTNLAFETSLFSSSAYQ